MKNNSQTHHFNSPPALSKQTKKKKKTARQPLRRHLHPSPRHHRRPRRPIRQAGLDASHPRPLPRGLGFAPPRRVSRAPVLGGGHGGQARRGGPEDGAGAVGVGDPGDGDHRLGGGVVAGELVFFPFLNSRERKKRDRIFFLSFFARPRSYCFRRPLSLPLPLLYASSKRKQKQQQAHAIWNVKKKKKNSHLKKNTPGGFDTARNTC